MIDRHFIGDVALAVLLAIPLAAFMQPEPVRLTHQLASNANGHRAASMTEQDRPVSLLR